MLCFFFLNLFLPSWRCISCRCPSPRRCYCNSSITPKESPHLQIISEGRGLFEIVVHLLQHTNVKTPILFSPSLPCLNPASLLLLCFFFFFCSPKSPHPTLFLSFQPTTPLLYLSPNQFLFHQASISSTALTTTMARWSHLLLCVPCKLSENTCGESSPTPQMKGNRCVRWEKPKIN